MPTSGPALREWAEARGYGGVYDAARLRALALARREVQERERERRSDQRFTAAQIRGLADEDRRAARLELESLRADPLYGLYKRWGQRAQNATVYDADVWRQSGRLVPIGRNVYRAGGAERRPTIDFTDVLDREAQQAGISSHDLPKYFERLARSERRAHDLARSAEAARREADAIRRGA